MSNLGEGEFSSSSLIGTENEEDFEEGYNTQEREDMGRSAIPSELELSDPLTQMPPGFQQGSSVKPCQKDQSVQQADSKSNQKSADIAAHTPYPQLRSLYASDSWLDNARNAVHKFLSAGTQVNFKLTGYHIVFAFIVGTLLYMFVSSSGYKRGRSDIVAEKVEKYLAVNSK